MADEKKSVLRRVRTAKRRAVQKALETVGSAERALNDSEFDALRKSFDAMMRDLDALGGGLLSHLVCTNRLFENTSKLANLLSERQALSTESAARNGNLKAGLDLSAARWAHLHTTVRRSMNAVVVGRALDPLRNLVGKTAADVGQECARRDGALVDVNAYSRQKRMAKASAARTRYELLGIKARTSLERAKIARDVVLADAAALVIATQAELAANAADCAEEVTAVLGGVVPDKIHTIRGRMRDLMERGGPELVDRKPGILRTVFDVGVGKKSVGQVRAEKINRDERRRMQREAASKYASVATSAEGSVQTTSLATFGIRHMGYPDDYERPDLLPKVGEAVSSSTMPGIHRITVHLCAALSTQFDQCLLTHCGT